MKNHTNNYLTTAGDNSDGISLIAGARIYTEPDFMDKTRQITIKIWPYLPSHTMQNNTDNPAVSH